MQDDRNALKRKIVERQQPLAPNLDRQSREETVGPQDFIPKDLTPTSEDEIQAEMKRMADKRAQQEQQDYITARRRQ